MQPRYAMVLRGGEVIDPAQGLRGRRDVAVADGKIAAVAESLPAGAAALSLDVSDKLVVPGLVDIHTHFYHKVTTIGANPDPSFLPVGVTTAVDAGSSGWRSWPGLRDFVMVPSRTRLYAFINVAGMGMLAPELTDIDERHEVQVRETARAVAAEPERVLGIKVRVNAPGGTGAANAIPVLRRAREAADAAGCRIMVHVAGSPIPLAQVVEHLKGGDIVTHVFNPSRHNILDEQGKVRPEIFEARARGVLFDVAHSHVVFDLLVIRAALDQGFPPDTLSSDYVLPDRMVGSRYNTVTVVMSTFLAMGVPLEQVIAGATARAAAAIGREQQCGSLRVGAPADIAVLELEERPTTFTDHAGRPVEARRQFRPLMTFREGSRVA